MRHDWYQNGVLSAWWFGGIALGGMFALGGSAFAHVAQTIVAVGVGAFCLAAPFLGVWITRCVTRKRPRRLRGERYADYAYIL